MSHSASGPLCLWQCFISNGKSNSLKAVFISSSDIYLTRSIGNHIQIRSGAYFFQTKCNFPVPHLLSNRAGFLVDKQSSPRQNHEAKIFMFNDMIMFSSNVKAPHKRPNLGWRIIFSVLTEDSPGLQVDAQDLAQCLISTRMSTTHLLAKESPRKDTAALHATLPPSTGDKDCCHSTNQTKFSCPWRSNSKWLVSWLLLPGRYPGHWW